MEGRGDEGGPGRPGEPAPGEDPTRVQPSTGARPGGAPGQQPGPRSGPGPGPREAARSEPAGRSREGYASVEDVVEPYLAAETDELRERIRRMRGLAIAGLLV
ncbi:MAG: hypothetical protein H0V55_12190, partial [Thermoleophilaceae bacterium]|nr:hypothetical protein [Thermoleophilaceae bacterium]